MLTPSDRFRPQPGRGGHVRHRRRPAAATNRPGQYDTKNPGGGRPLRARRPHTPRRTAARGPRRVTLQVAGLTAGAVLTAATVASDQSAAMVIGDTGAAPVSSEQQPRLAGIPDKAALAATRTRAARKPPKPPTPRPRSERPREPDRPATVGDAGGGLSWTASWYGPGFAGRRTANGEIFRPGGLTAAHKSLPFGTRMLVRNPDSDRSVWVRVNDRGPYVGGRQLDLSQGAAEAIGLGGVGRVIVQIA
jgi:rare lipoprotein A